MEQLIKIRITAIVFILLLVSCQKTQKEYYSDGNIKSVIKLNRNNNYDGQAKFYYDNGGIKMIVNYDNGYVKDCKVFYPNGQLKWESPYVNNMKQGDYNEYYPNGAIKAKILFRKDTVIHSKDYDTLGSLTSEYVKLDTNDIPKFDSSFIRILGKRINSDNFTKVQLKVPNIPSSQLIPEIANGEIKLINRVEGIWEAKSLRDDKPTYLWIRILLQNNKYYTLGYNIYSPTKK